MAISTFCRSCAQHFQIENGVALPPFGANDPGPRFRSTATEGKAYEDVGFDEGDSAQKTPEKKPIPAPAPRRSFFGLARLLSSRTEDSTPIEPEKKPVRCFECGHVHEVSIAASSTQCARCSLYISLSNEDIREHYSRNIRTRGDVVIHKKGSVIGCEIACHNLTVLGGISGSVDCSGNAIFKNSGKVLGSMHCKNVAIERKCEVDFPQGIIAESADIYGVVRGDILCSGTINIYKTGSVLGDATAKAIVMKDGGVLTGQMHIQHDTNIDLPEKGSSRATAPSAKKTTDNNKAKQKKTATKEPAQAKAKAEPKAAAAAKSSDVASEKSAPTDQVSHQSSDKKNISSQPAATPTQTEPKKAPVATTEDKDNQPKPQPSPKGVTAPAKTTASSESPPQDSDSDNGDKPFALSPD
ncbi:MAG: polymer-forming cytoskeletal protein [Verrucomicrobiales bacterium]|nr:polymer-forming cytoskeletal protein [Verrucomicrobiales bacterium]